MRKQLCHKSHKIPSPSRGGLGRGESDWDCHLVFLTTPCSKIVLNYPTPLLLNSPLPNPPREGEGILQFLFVVSEQPAYTAPERIAP
jgi:hypothetical protein